MLKSIRSFDRGLWVLEILDRRTPLSLADLAKSTSLPKATLLRILQTLADRGWVHKRLNDGRYVLAKTRRPSEAADVDTARAAKLASPGLKSLTAAVGLACDLTLAIEPGILEVVDSTRQRREGGVDPIVAGFRPSLVFSSPGRTFLAACTSAEREGHLQHILRTDSPAERFAITSGALATEIEQTLERGYALRAPGYWPDSSEHGEEPMDIAVPLLGRAGPVGSLSLVWPAREERYEDIVVNCLAQLSAAAERIARQIFRLGG